MIHQHPLNCIVPPHMLRKLMESKDKKLRDMALNTLLSSTAIRAQRSILSLLPMGLSAGQKRRTIYDAKNQAPDPPQGMLIRGEGDAPATDVTVNEAYDGLGATYDF